MLDMITKQFFLEPDVEMIPSKTIDDTAEQMRNCMNKVRTAYKEAKYEISYTRIRPTELIGIRKSLERIIKHLSALSRGLQSERELFDSILASLGDNNSDDDDDDDDNEEYDNDDDDGGNKNDVSPRLSQPDNGDTNGYQKKGTGTTTLSTVDEAPYMTRVTTAEDNNHLSPKATQLARLSAPPVPATTNDLRMTAMHNKQFKSNPTIPRISDVETDDENEDDGSINTERNQLSVSSLKSFLHIPKRLSPSTQNQAVATPPKRKKSLRSRKDRNLLFTYLESLREPLTQLSIRCVDALVCVRDGISRAIINDSKAANKDDDNTMGDSLWLSFLFSDCCFKKSKSKNKSTDDNVQGEKRTSNETASSSRPERCRRSHDPNNCTCADDMIQALRQFDADEKGRICALYEHNKRFSNTSQNEDEDAPLDLTIREELFMVFFFIFTIREICKELEIMTRKMSELRERYKNKPRKRLYIPRPTLRWLRKWISWNNHQSTRDKGGYSPGI